ncbi:hypothetical protein CSV80_01015 [Sporosarcina sp. P12(2017)]|nr:hypothetical protein CSV81_01015 [Sporosarcina sp. P10]PIC62457.1 hypothetical protein CSV80_01015 [Sporosarcina sp. P12(2017)]
MNTVVRLSISHQIDMKESFAMGRIVHIKPHLVAVTMIVKHHDHAASKSYILKLLKIKLVPYTVL